MENLNNKIAVYLGRTDFEKEILLQDDMVGGVSKPYIREWNVADKSKPTDEQLDALDAQATTLESNNQVDSTRRKEYGDWQDQLDEIYHDIDAWKARLLTIKNSNPKS